jgi:hypothetical protein
MYLLTELPYIGRVTAGLLIPVPILLSPTEPTLPRLPEEAQPFLPTENLSAESGTLSPAAARWHQVQATCLQEVKVDYGTDFKLVDDDIVFTPDGDVELVSSPACVAQDIDQTLKTAKGRLFWDKEEGSTMMLMLNDSAIDPNAVLAELERVAIKDQRVNPTSVNPYRKDLKTYRLEFMPVKSVSTQTLEYDINKGNGNG